MFYDCYNLLQLLQFIYKIIVDMSEIGSRMVTSTTQTEMQKMSRPFTKEEAERNLAALKETSRILAELNAEIKAANDAAELKEAKRKADAAEWSRRLAERDLPKDILKIIDAATIEYEYNKAKGYSNE